MLGLLYCNIQYVAGDPAGYHRYCVEAVRPILNAIARHKNWRISIAISGCGLEFISTFYPGMLCQLRSLIDSGQIELISSTYSPSFWPAYPGEDLLKSVEMNRRVLTTLGLVSSPVFFAHEGLFGLGLSRLAEVFDTVVCKDDYLSHFLGDVDVHCAYRHGTMRIIVGSNHILNELRRSRASFPDKVATLSLFGPYIEMVGDNVSTEVKSVRENDTGYWYHLAGVYS